MNEKYWAEQSAYAALGWCRQNAVATNSSIILFSLSLRSLLFCMVMKIYMLFNYQENKIRCKNKPHPSGDDFLKKT